MDKTDLFGKPLPPVRKCIHCKKEKDYHKAKTFNCPTGTKGRVGYTTYAETVFTPRPEK